jgi:hypothetical protein
MDRANALVAVNSREDAPLFALIFNHVSLTFAFVGSAEKLFDEERQQLADFSMLRNPAQHVGAAAGALAIAGGCRFCSLPGGGFTRCPGRLRYLCYELACGVRRLAAGGQVV